MPQNLGPFPPITGYVTPFSGRPGGTLAFKISSQDDADFSASVVRIDCADPNPAGPGMKLVPVPVPLAARYPGRAQPVYSGSCAWGPLPSLTGLVAISVTLTLRPTLIDDSCQTLFSLQDKTGERGIALALRKGELMVLQTSPTGVEQHATGLPLALRHWTRLRVDIDCVTGRMVLTVDSIDPRTRHRDAIAAHVDVVASAAALDTICFGARWLGHPADVFNGQIEAPAVQGDGQLLAAWDFSRDMMHTWVTDSVDASRRLELVNLPGRAVRSSSWTGRHMDWKVAPQDYAAMHFHADDLIDCGWDTSLNLTIPEDMPSGVYGLVLKNAAGSDTIPFYVTPPKAGPKARILVLASTLTYVAYANHARGNFTGELAERVKQWGAYPHNPDVITAFGASTYNRHADGSGISLSSRLRPMLTMRPGYLTFPDPRGSGMRHFSADSHLTDWLRHQGYDFDVITDEDLDDEGLEILKGYDVVMTGSHPEYHTRRMLDALIDYREQGGKLMYLGGNGFYWKIARTAELPHVLEIRRAEGGIRAWASEPGEYYHQLDGEYGGMWRRNGVPPQAVGAVGFCVQGLFEGSYYTRTPESADPDVSWIFEGVTEPRIGDYGLAGGGAAGFELDQAASDLGTPDYVKVIAVSEGHGPTFKTVPEEILTWTLSAGSARPHEGVCGHMVYGAAPGGSALFAVGSITFLGSLSHNGYRNDVSRILDNCLRRFTAAE